MTGAECSSLPSSVADTSLWTQLSHLLSSHWTLLPLPIGPSPQTLPTCSAFVLEVQLFWIFFFFPRVASVSTPSVILEFCRRISELPITSEMPSVTLTSFPILVALGPHRQLVKWAHMSLRLLCILHSTGSSQATLGVTDWVGTQPPASPPLPITQWQWYWNNSASFSPVSLPDQCPTLFPTLSYLKTMWPELLF